MKSTELRLGNWILSDLGEPQQVCALGKNTIEVTMGGKDWSTCFRPEPIPITSEWLERLGFERRNYSEETKNDYWIHKNMFPDYFVYYLPYYNMNIHLGNLTLKYTHQLQNLYFSLTGEELKQVTT